MALSDFQRISKQPITDVATDTIREHLLSGAMVPGARLTESALAERLGIGRATVRMALNQLNFEGVVIKTPYSGWHVVTLTPRSVWEIWSLRATFEGLAANIVAGNLDIRRRRSIEKSRDRLYTACESADMTEVSRCDFDLHRTTIELSDHRLLAEHYRLVEYKVRLYIATSNAHVAVDGHDVINQHQGLIEALLAGDPESAEEKARQHNLSEGLRLSQWLDTPMSEK